MNDEDLCILLEDFMDFLNSLEALCVKMRIQIGKLLGPRKVSWNPDTIRWTQTEGSSGPYERSDDVNNPEFKVMLRDLADHGGKLSRRGYFYWVFKNGSTVGRKRRKRAQELVI